MPILKANELDFSKKKIKMIIAGFPGIGKSTLSLSAPNPLHIDIDEGVDRVSAEHRKDTLVFTDYNEMVNDLIKYNENKELDVYETFVIDTGGKLLDIMKPAVIKENPQNGQRDGSLTMKGYGAVGTKFKQFMDLLISMGKHVIVVFHAKEEKDGDNTRLRIAVEGQTKDKIWEYMDLGGFVEMHGKARTIGFSNCERYFAKGTHGISGTYEIPHLENNAPNDFLQHLFGKVIQDLQEGAKKASKDKITYDNAMKVKPFIDSSSNLEQINSMLTRILELPHALTSEKELKTHLMQKAKELGFSYDKDKQTFVESNSNPTE
jgi:hypothetical protein